jgi:penicillin-binding protein
MKQKMFNEDVQTGGSTITQQVARNYFLSLDVTTSRKVKEIFLALRLERFLTKDQILQAYLNRVPFGNGSTGYNVYGIKSAAIGIFGIDDLAKLNVAQSAYLAGLPQSPSAYSAFSGTGAFNEAGFNRAIKRQKLVLQRMREEKKITKAQYTEALAFDIRATLAKPGTKAYSTYPYLMVEVERQAAEQLILRNNPDVTIAELRLPENRDMIDKAIADMLDKGYQIHTTVDQTIYDSMQQIAANPSNFTPNGSGASQVEQIGGVLLNNKTGAILGMIEGRDFNLTQYNHATQAKRQPGSTMKPIAAYLPALESGDIQPGSIIDDVPILLEDGAKGKHIPNNWNNQFQGLITARTALNQSYNIPALYLFNNVIGIDQAWTFARKLGITTLTDEDNTAATGVIGGLTNGVTIEEMTNAYASIPNEGTFVDAYLIDKIVDVNGEVVYQHRVKPKKTYSPQTAYLMTDMLKTVITNGTAKSILQRFKYSNQVEIAGKTGSTQNDRDAWFVGFTPDITLGVWAGYDKDATLTTKSNLPQGPGTQRAKNVWSAVMNQVVEKKADLLKTRKFTIPKAIVPRVVSSVSGKLPSDAVTASGLVHTDLFNTKFSPQEEDTAYVSASYVTVNGLNYIPKDSTPKDFIKQAMLVHRETSISSLMTEIAGLLSSYSEKDRPMKSKTVPMSTRDYYPKDVARTAPTEVDPRLEDGKLPNDVSDVELTKLTATTAKISFKPSTSKDVIGYRIYLSIEGKPFITSTSQNIWADAPKERLVLLSPGKKYSYKVVAVDVAGKESIAKTIVSMK